MKYKTVSAGILTTGFLAISFLQFQAVRAYASHLVDPLTAPLTSPTGTPTPTPTDAPITSPITETPTPTPTDAPLTSPITPTPTPTDAPITAPEQDPSLTPTATPSPTPETDPVPTPEEPITPSPEPTSAPSQNQSSSNNNNNSGGGNTNNSSPKECSDTMPKNAPVLQRIIQTNKNQVILFWKKSDGPATYYLVSFGTKRGADQYATGHIGNGETTSTSVGSLSTGGTYYFKARAGNNCKPGAYSNELGIRLGTRTFAISNYAGSVIPLRTHNALILNQQPSVGSVKKMIVVPTPPAVPSAKQNQNFLTQINSFFNKLLGK